MKGFAGATAAAGPAWERIELVVFDVDGTLYHAGRLRVLMAAWLAVHALGQGSLATLRRLAAFRRIREQLAQTQPDDFLTLQYLLAAQHTGCSPSRLHALVEDWMERRPLRLLRACARPGVHALFNRLRQRGVRVAVLSDYPARAKLAALGLRADLVLWAGDAGVGRLKPDPQGLLQILARTGVSPARAVMVGDRLDRDGLAARRAGMAAVILGRPGRARGRAGAAAGDGGPLPPGCAPTYWARGFDDTAFAPIFDGARPTPRPSPGIAQVLRYAGVGGLAAALDLGAFALLEARGISQRVAGAGPLPPVLVSATLSFALAAGFNYLASARWVFGRSWRSARRALQFVVGASVGLAVNAGTTAGLAAVALWPPTLAKVAGVGLAFGVNYLVNARWVFAKQPRAAGRLSSVPRRGVCGVASQTGGRTRRWAAAAAAWPRRPSARE